MAFARGDVVVFRFQAQEFRVHRAVLAEQLPYFDAATRHGRDTNDIGHENFHPTSPVKLIAMDATLFAALVGWAYSNNVKELFCRKDATLPYWERVAAIVGSTPLAQQLDVYKKGAQKRSPCVRRMWQCGRALGAISNRVYDAAVLLVSLVCLACKALAALGSAVGWLVLLLLIARLTNRPSELRELALITERGLNTTLATIWPTKDTCGKCDSWQWVETVELHYDPGTLKQYATLSGARYPAKVPSTSTPAPPRLNIGTFLFMNASAGDLDSLVGGAGTLFSYTCRAATDLVEAIGGLVMEFANLSTALARRL